MKEVIEVSIPSLEELVLFQLPKLERCFCNFVKDLSSSLRVLMIIKCHVLKTFPLFESCEKLNIEKKSWLCRLDKLTIRDCSQLKISNHLPPSSTVSELSILRVLSIPDMEVSSREELRIGSSFGDSEVMVLDDEILAFHNLRMLTRLNIQCENTVYISFHGFRQLVNLKYLEIHDCKEIFSTHVVQDPTDEYAAATNCSALPSLRLLSVSDCGMVGNWLSVLLRHVQAVEEFDLYKLSIEEDESNLSDPGSGLEASSLGSSYNNALAIPLSDGLLHMPSNLLSSVKKMAIQDCDELTYQGSKVGFSRFTSLEELSILECPDLILSLVHCGENNDSANGRWFLPLSLRVINISGCPETLQLCFPENRSCLKSLKVQDSPRLKYLQIHSCTALEKLEIKECELLAAVEGLQSLGSLRVLNVYSCPLLPPGLEHLSRQGPSNT